MVERAFVRKLFIKYLKSIAPEAFVYKIPDGLALTPTGHRWAVNRPFDLFMIYQGEIYCFECKRITRKPKTLYLSSLLKPHQFMALETVASQGAHVSVIIEVDLGDIIECYCTKLFVSRRPFDKVAHKLFVAQQQYRQRWAITWRNEEGVQLLR